MFKLFVVISKETMITGFDTFNNLIKKAKNVNSEDFVGTQRLYLSGYDKMMNTHHAGHS